MFESASSFNGQKKCLRALIPVIDSEKFEVLVPVIDNEGLRGLVPVIDNERFESASSCNRQ